jgi:hypothetical protein
MWRLSWTQLQPNEAAQKIATAGSNVGTGHKGRLTTSTIGPTNCRVHPENNQES